MLLPDDGFMWTETCWGSFYNFKYFNNLRILQFVCISCKIKCLILFVHGATMKLILIFICITVINFILWTFSYKYNLLLFLLKNIHGNLSNYCHKIVFKTDNISFTFWCHLYLYYGAMSVLNYPPRTAPNRWRVCLNGD